MVREIKDNMKVFLKYVTGTRKTRDNVDPLLAEVSALALWMLCPSSGKERSSLEVVNMESPKEKSCLSNLTGFRDAITRWVGEGTAVNDVYLDSSKATNRNGNIGNS